MCSRLDVNKKEGFLPLKQPISAFCDLKTSVAQLIERAGFLFSLYFMHFMGNQSQNYRIDYGAKRLLQEREKRFFYRTHNICPLAMQLIKKKTHQAFTCNSPITNFSATFLYNRRCLTSGKTKYETKSK